MPLNKNKQEQIKKIVILDCEDRYLLDNYSWFIDKNGYIIGDKMVDGKKNRVRLHQLIVGKPVKGMCTDHKNGNKLDNRRENLHIVSYSYNIFNRNKRLDSRQKYKGIQLLKYGKWRARTSHGEHLGVFNTPEEAHIAFINYSENKFGGKLYAIT